MILSIITSYEIFEKFLKKSWSLIKNPQSCWKISLNSALYSTMPWKRSLKSIFSVNDIEISRRKPSPNFKNDDTNLMIFEAPSISVCEYCLRDESAALKITSVNALRLEIRPKKWWTLEGMTISQSDVHSLKTDSPIVIIELGIIIDFNDEQLSKVDLSKDVILDDRIFISESEVHFSNAHIPILATLGGITIWTKEEHFEKDESPIILTEDGIMTFWRNEQLLNAFASISLIESGIVISLSEWQLLNKKGPILLIEEGRSTLLNAVQEKNNPSLIEVTEEGIFISFNEKQLLKANDFIDVKDEGESNSIVCNDEQPKNAENPMEVIEEGIRIIFKDEHP